jgi:uncharacterized membrane protein YdjX (TVP38/TMEM64 family)
VAAQPALPRLGPRAALHALAAAAVLTIAALALRHLPGRAHALAVALAGLGPTAALALVAIYVPWMVFGLPTAPLGLAAGFALGPLAGALVADAGCTLGACTAFLVARGVARGAVERLAARVPVVAPVRRAVRVHGFRVIVLLRLAPLLPVPFMNHLLGLTSVPLRTYLLATLAGTVPSALTAASVGALVRSAGARIDEHTLHLTGAALLAAVLASLALGALAVRLLARELARGEPG